MNAPYGLISTFLPTVLAPAPSSTKHPKKTESDRGPGRSVRQGLSWSLMEARERGGTYRHEAPNPHFRGHIMPPYNDTTYPTMLDALRVSLDGNNLRLAEKIYEYAHRQLLVEKEMPGRLGQFAEIALIRR